MKFRTKLYALSGAAGALAILIALGLLLSPENMQKRALKGDLLSAKMKDKVAAIQIEAGGKSLALKKADGGWTMEKAGLDFPAKADKVDSLLAALSAAQEMYKVSSKKDSFAKLGLEPAAKRIKLSDQGGKSLLSLVLGNAEAGGKRIYLAFEGKDASYSVKDNLDSFLSTEDRTWADLRVLRQDFKQGDIQEISVEGGLPASEGQEALSLKYRLLRDSKKGWAVDGNSSFALDADKVDQFVLAVTDLEGDSFVTDKADEAKKLLEAPAATISFRSGKGTEYRILVSAANAEKVHVAKEASVGIMVNVNDWNVRNALRTLDSLRFVEPDKKAGGKKK